MPNNFIDFDNNRRQLLDYDSRTDGQPVYIGKAHPGTLASEAKWQIRKITYDGSDHATDISFANGSVAYDKEWNARTTYDYSPDA